MFFFFDNLKKSIRLEVLMMMINCWKQGEWEQHASILYILGRENVVVELKTSKREWKRALLRHGLSYEGQGRNMELKVELKDGDRSRDIYRLPRGLCVTILKFEPHNDRQLRSDIIF